MLMGSADANRIDSLLNVAEKRLDEVQHEAAMKLLAYDHERYPSDGCAITLSCLLQAAGIDVPDTYLAIQMGRVLEKRGWQPIEVGQQKAGDIGSTCGLRPDHGSDHIYFVVEILADGSMLVADNQSHTLHPRWADGRGKTPTKFFLRA